MRTVVLVFSFVLWGASLVCLAVFAVFAAGMIWDKMKQLREERKPRGPT